MLLSFHTVACVAILYVIRPPFVVTSKGSVNGCTVAAISLIAAACCAVAHAANASPSDLFRGALDIARFNHYQ